MISGAVFMSLVATQASAQDETAVEEIVVTISSCSDTGTLVAAWDDPRGFGGLTTQAQKLSDLETNIREAVAVHFDPGDLPKQVRLHFVDDPVLAAA